MSDDVAAVAEVLDCVQDSLRNWLIGGIATLKGRPESWGFCGARITNALDQLRVALSATPARSPRLLECGSGFGFIAALARELGFTVTGIEIEPGYIETSRRLFPSVRIEEADLLTFDRYGAFDAVYYYGPFADDEVQARFERRIEDSLHPGGIVLASRKVTHDFRESGAFEVLSHDGSQAWVIQKK
ncbi:MAG TPA: class I SAM-dependent methyltransferase [Candidatus Acidoferrum sp.]|nr:class I SAM-dependent methyltransferase [Candidatus Acidoferrum sp.]